MWLLQGPVCLFSCCFSGIDWKQLRGVTLLLLLLPLLLLLLLLLLLPGLLLMLKPFNENRDSLN